MNKLNHPIWLQRFLTIALLIGAFAANGQDKTVTGTVSDAQDGITLPGVTVVVKGTTNGVATDIDGNYSIEVPEDAILVFSFIGYQSQELAVGARSVIDVQLGTDIQELSEVVIIGYGQVEKGDVTGVVNKIDEKQFNKGMIVSPERLIAGKVAGVQITPNSGEPGGGTTIRIRGGASLGGGSDPLYVVDGVVLPQGGNNVSGTRNPLSFINPSDIADITILKDASAAAIYGSQGASGVIIITTKGGTSGKPQFTYDGSFSVSSIRGQVDMLSTPEFIFTVDRQAPQNLDDLGVDGVLSDTNWFDEITQTAVGQNHNISSSFGIGDNTKSRVSLNYQNLDGVLKTSNTERIAGSISLDHEALNGDLKINWNSKHSLINNRFAENAVGGALIFAPTQPIRDTDSTYFEWNNTLAPLNPVSQVDRRKNIGRTIRNLYSLKLEYALPFVEGLSATVIGSFDKSSGVSQDITLVGDRPGDLGGFNFNEDELLRRNIEGYFTYTKNIGDIDIDFTAGYSYYDNQFTVNRRLRKIEDISLDSLSIPDPLEYLTDGQLEQNAGLLESPLIFDENNSRLISFYGRTNFKYKDKYLLTATLRRDGTSRISQTGEPWKIFPSVALGWRVIDEPFMQNQKVVSNLKLRLGYGESGNPNNIGDFDNVFFYSGGDDRVQYIFGNDTINTVRPNAVDTNLGWETTNTTNLGVDFGFFDGRLSGSIDAYNTVTSNLLLDIIFPIGSIPGDRAVTNVASFESRGLELQLNSIIVDKSDLRIDVNFNAAYNTNEITKLNRSNDPNDPGIRRSGISGDVGRTIQVWRVGENNTSFFTYQHQRDANGNPLPDRTDHNGDGLQNDLDIYVDQNGDGQINENDLIVNQQAAPDWIYGLTSNVQFKKFDLAMTWRGAIGNYNYNNTFSQFGNFEGVNQPGFANNIHRSAYRTDFTDRQLLSDAYLQSASFLRLDNITVGYSFSSLGEKLNGRVYVTGTNLLTLTSYDGLDPEAGGQGGIDNNPYPIAQMYVVGLNLNF
ncbi:MAG: SusC/RagA family TonB-linked outer membrane protein [Ekhidna sp.]|nr:SusC/RagA family TonB-linked outer membrane protein [Ekhidna sp.]